MVLQPASTAIENSDSSIKETKRFMCFSCGGSRVTGLRRSHDDHQHLPSLQSLALSSTFSPAFCTSLPAPATVLQPLSIPTENMPSRANISIRFIRLLPCFAWQPQATETPKPACCV